MNFIRAIPIIGQYIGASLVCSYCYSYHNCCEWAIKQPKMMLKTKGPFLKNVLAALFQTRTVHSDLLEKKKLNKTKWNRPKLKLSSNEILIFQ